MANLWFKILVIIMAIFVIAVVIANIIYFNHIRQGKIVSTGSATALAILNFIILLVAVVVMILAFYTIFSSGGTKKYCPVTSTAPVTVKTPPPQLVTKGCPPCGTTQYVTPTYVTQQPQITTAYVSQPQQQPKRYKTQQTVIETPEITTISQPRAMTGTQTYEIKTESLAPEAYSYQSNVTLVEPTTYTRSNTPGPVTTYV